MIAVGFWSKTVVLSLIPGNLENSILHRLLEICCCWFGFLLFAKQIIDSQSLAAWVAAVRFRFSPLDRHFIALLLCSSARRKIVLSWLGSWTKNLGWPNWALFLLRCFSSPGKDRGTIVCLHCSSASLGQGRAFFSAIVPSEQLRGYSGAVHPVYGPNLLEHRNIFQVVKTNYFCSRPKGCEARHRVAIIVPYRDREPHLRYFRLFGTSGKMTEIQFLVAELSCWTYTGFSRGSRYNFLQ